MASAEQPRYTIDSFKVPIDLPFNGTYSKIDDYQKTGYCWIRCDYSTLWEAGRGPRNEIRSDISISERSIAIEYHAVTRGFEQDRTTIQTCVDDLRRARSNANYTPRDSLVEFNDTANRTSYIFKRTIDSKYPSNDNSGYGGMTILLNASGSAEINWFMADYDLAAAKAMIQAIEDRCNLLWGAQGNVATALPSATAVPTVTMAPSPSGWQWPGWATLETTPPQHYDEYSSMVRSWFGSVEVMRAGSNKWEPARAGYHLDAGAKVRTLEGGKTELLLYGGRVVRLGPESILEIPIQYPVKTFGDYLRLIKGEFWLFIDKTRDPYKYIETPNAIAGVKGTRFEVVVDDNGTTVSVFEGVVEVSSLNGTGNVSVGANQRVVVPADGMPRAPAGFDATKVDLWWEAFPPLTDEAGAATPGHAASPAKQSPAPGLLAGALAIVAVVCLLRKKRGP